MPLDLSPDRPIEKPDDDLFERGGFTDMLARRLVLPPGAPSMVFGLEGPWGMGKTSCLNLVTEAVSAASPECRIVHFRPWLAGNLGSVVEAFLLQLAAEIGHTNNGENAKAVSRKLLSFAKFLPPLKLVPGAEPWGTIVEKALIAVGNSVGAGADLADLNLAGKRHDLDIAIAELDTPILVTIDDIDRLPPQEVRTVIQLVKAVCDFPRTAYLLAYDPEPVYEALKYGDLYDGRKYLNKIIQVRCPLPRISFLQRYHFLREELGVFLERADIELDERGKEILRELLEDTALVRGLDSPRSIVRLINRLWMTVPQLDGEVAFADTVAFEALEMVWPRVARTIRDHAARFLGATTFDERPIVSDFDRHRKAQASDDATEPPQHIQLMLKVYDEDKKQTIMSIVKFLFPSCQGIKPSTSHNHVTDHRVCTKEALQKLLQAGVTSSSWSARELQEVLARPKLRQAYADDLLQHGEIDGWFFFAESFLRPDTPAPEGLATLACETAHMAFLGKGSEQSGQAGTFIVRIIKLQPSRERQKRTLMAAAEQSASLSVSESVLCDLLKDAGLWEDGVFRQKPRDERLKHSDALPRKDLLVAKDIWLDQVREAARDGRLLKEPHVPGILFRWGQLNNDDYGEVQQCIASLDDAGLEALLESWHGHSLQGLEKLVSDTPTLTNRLAELKLADDLRAMAVSWIAYLQSSEGERDQKADDREDVDPDATLADAPQAEGAPES